MSGGVTVFKMNYERVIAYDFPKSGIVPLFSGSSYNRRSLETRRKARKEIETALLDRDHLPFHTGDTTMAKSAAERMQLLNRRAAERKKKDKYSLSNTSGRKIRNKASAFFNAQAKAFITLTFIQDVGDKKALECLKNMLHQWRKDRRNAGEEFNYLWVAERQANGRIHFHVMVSDFFCLVKENIRWLRIQYNAGLTHYSEKLGVVWSREMMETTAAHCWVEQYNKQEKSWHPVSAHMKYHEAAQVKAELTSQAPAWYRLKSAVQDWLNPFDIEYIRNQSHLSHYLTKYITKTANNEDRTEFDFLPWNCSKLVSACFTEQIIMPELFFDATTGRNSITVEKQFVRRRTGEVVDPGTVIFPTLHKNDWAISVNILNKDYYNSWLYDMKAINKRILADGWAPVIDEYSPGEYFKDYCRPLDIEEINSLAQIEPGYLDLTPGGESLEHFATMSRTKTQMIR